MFRALLLAMIVSLYAYTGIVVMNFGWTLLPVFFGDVAALTWPGQFNFDFSCFLILAGLWTAWRSRFSVGGLVLGLFVVIGGMAVFAPYVLWLTFEAGGEIKQILTGNEA